jgi:hypothetical protein
MACCWPPCSVCNSIPYRSPPPHQAVTNITPRMQPQVKVAPPARSIGPRTATAAISLWSVLDLCVDWDSPGARELLIVQETFGVKSQHSLHNVHCAQEQRLSVSSEREPSDNAKQRASRSIYRLLRQPSSSEHQQDPTQQHHQLTSEQREKACRCPFTVSCARDRSSQHPSTLIVRVSEKATGATIGPGQGRATDARGSTRERKRKRTADCGCR